MLKLGVLACAICAGAAGAFAWTKMAVRAHETSAAAAGMPSIEELHTKARPRNLADQTIKEPF